MFHVEACPLATGTAPTRSAVDAISALPTLRWLGAWGLIPATGGLAGRPGVCDVVHLIKVLRMTRIWRLNLIKSAVSGSVVNPSALRFGGLMFSSMGTLHVIACVYWYVCRRVWPTRRWDNSEWLPYLHGDRTGSDWEHGKVPSLEVIASAYSWASYWAISNALADGPTPHNTLQSAFTAVVFIIGLIFQSFFVASASSLLANMDATRSERVRHLEQIQTFLRSRNIPSRTLNKVVSYYQYLWLCGDGSGVEKLMRDIPRTLKAEIDLYLKRRLIESVPFFRTCSVAEILTVVQSLRPRIMMPKDYIIRQGDQGDEMYFIVRGNANVVVAKAGMPDVVVVTLRQGQFFGESALMEGDIAVRNASVRSEGFSELMSLSRADFREMTIQFPHFKEFVQKLARERARAKKEKEDKEREKSGSGRRGSMVRRESSRMGTLRRSISSIRTNTVVDRSPSVSGRGGGGDSSTDGEGAASPSESGRRGLGRFGQGLRQASFSARGSISGLVGKRGSLTPADAPIVEGEEKGGDEPAAPPSPNSPRSPAPTSTTETLIDRMHARGHLSRGLSRNASMGDRQSSTASRASAGSGGKGDGETASLKLEEADGDGDGAGGAADRDPTVGVSYVDAPTPGPSRAPPKRGNMRANSINLISSGMDRLGLASKSRVAGASGAARSRPGGLLSRSPSVENRASGSVFDEVARSLERAPVEAITGGSPLLGDRASADRSSAERTRHSITEVNEDDGEAPAPTPAPAPASARPSHSDSVDLEEAEKIFSLDA